MKSYLYLFILSVSFPLALSAQSESEGYAETYLQRSIGARSIGFCGAYTAIVNEPNAVFVNPGALSSQAESPTFSSMYSALSFGKYQATLAYAQNFTNNFGIGVGVNNYSSGSFMRRDALGRALGGATHQQYSLSIGAGYTVGSAGFGIVGKYLRNSLSGENFNGEGFAFDAGTKFPFAKFFTLGVAVQNIGFIQWNNSTSFRETLPFIIRTGISTEIALSKEEYTTRSTTLGTQDTVTLPATHYILLALEGTYIRNNRSPQITLGVEYAPAELFRIRSGIVLLGDSFGAVQLFPMSAYSAGVSYRILANELPFQLQVDYAASHDFTSLASLSHHFSFILSL